MDLRARRRRRGAGALGHAVADDPAALSDRLDHRRRRHRPERGAAPSHRLAAGPGARARRPVAARRADHLLPDAARGDGAGGAGARGRRQHNAPPRAVRSSGREPRTLVGDAQTLPALAGTSSPSSRSATQPDRSGSWPPPRTSTPCEPRSERRRPCSRLPGQGAGVGRVRRRRSRRDQRRSARLERALRGPHALHAGAGDARAVIAPETTSPRPRIRVLDTLHGQDHPPDARRAHAPRRHRRRAARHPRRRGAAGDHSRRRELAGHDAHARA